MNDSGGAVVTAGAISARIDRLPATRTIWTYIVLLGFGMFFELYDLLFTAYVAPSLVKSGVLTAKTAGLFGTTGVASFIAALFTGLFIGTLLCGFLADRFGRRAIFTWSLLWYSAANIMVALQSDAFGLNFWRLVSGIGLGVEIVTIGAYLSELAPKGIRGRAFAINQAIGFVCVPVASFLAYALVPAAPLGIEGWRWVVMIGALAAPVVVFLRRRLPESPRWLAKHGRLAEADRVLSAIEKKVAAEYGKPLPPPGPDEPIATASRFVDLWAPGVRGRVILMSIFNIFQTIGFYGFSNWVPSLLVKQGITISTSLGYTTLIALAAPVGPLIGFALGDRLERKWIIVGGRRPDPCLRSHLRADARGGPHHRHGRRADAGRQHPVLQLPRLSAGAVSDRDPGACGRLRLFLEPALGDLQLLHHRLRARGLRRFRRLRLHRRGDGDRDGHDRRLRAADDQFGAGEDFAGAGNYAFTGHCPRPVNNRGKKKAARNLSPRGILNVLARSAGEGTTRYSAAIARGWP